MSKVVKHLCTECKKQLTTMVIGMDKKEYCPECAKEKKVIQMAILDIGYSTIDVVIKESK